MSLPRVSRSLLHLRAYSQAPRNILETHARPLVASGAVDRRWGLREPPQQHAWSGRELVLRSGARLCGAKLLREHFTRQRCKMANVVGMLFAYLLLLMWYQYVPVTPPTVYITAIQMAPLGERFFKSSCYPLVVQPGVRVVVLTCNM